MRKPTQTILIIDLSSGEISDYKELLQQDSKVRYRCFIASSETQILALSQSHQFDAILLDSHNSGLRSRSLRDRSASTVIEWLKSQLGENCPPIIVIDRNDARLATRAIKAGAVDYLVREELSRDILVQSLQEAIANSTNQTQLKGSDIIDISDRHHPTERELEARLQSIANLVPDLLWDSEPDGSTNWYNHRWMEYTGQTFEQAIGWGWIDAIHPDDRATSARRYHEAVQQGVQLQQEHRIRRYDGEYRWFVVKASPMKDENGKVIKMYGAATDIHDQWVVLKALRESEAKYRSLFNSIDVGFCIIEVLFDPQENPFDYRFLETNPAFIAQTGLTNAIGKTILEFAPKHEKFWFETYGEIALNGKPARFEHQAEALPSYHWYEVYAFRIGEPKERHVAVLFRDITDRKRSEAQLRRVAELDAFRLKLSDTLRSLDDSVEIQAEACRLLGEHLGIDRAYYVEVNEAENYARVDRNYLRGDSPSLVGTFPLTKYGWVVPYLRRGETITVADTATADIVPDIDRELMAALSINSHITLPIIKDRALVGALCVTESIPHEWTATEIELVRETAERIWGDIQRARAEKSLQEAQENLNIAIQAAQMGTWTLNLTQDAALQSSLRHDQIFGYDTLQAEWGQEIAKRHVVQEDHEIFDAAFARARETGKLDFEVRIKWRDGSIHWMAVRGRFYFDENGKPVSGSGVNFDITDLKQAEANQLQLLKEQVIRKQEEQRAETLAELDRAKTKFFSNISHEFRTPLTLLLAPLEDALRDLNYPLSEPQRKRLELSRRNGLRLLKLVNSLLDFSRVEAGRLQANYEPTDLATYTAELASTFRSAIENGGLQLVVDCPPLSASVYVDRSMWEKIVLNLLSNAFKFTFEGTITISLQAIPEDSVELIVRDTGIGIAAEELPQIFDRFYQTKERQGRSSEGSGIGLSLVKELVKLHGGEIEVSSDIDRGTTFTVTIPTRKDPLQQETKPPTSTAISANSFVAEAERWLPPEETNLPLPTSNSKKGRILIVDDNADLQNYLQRLLERDYQVETANNGLAALSKIRQAVEEQNNSNSYDLVLADIMMPEMDGFELLRSLRADPHTQEIPIILLSARAGEESRVEGLVAGADDYLIKPFSPRELLARVNTHLQLVKMREEATYRERVMEEIQKLNATLEARVQERTAQLEEVNRELEAFSYTVSHDLQTPLRYISSFAQKLQIKLNSAQLDSISQSYLKIIVEATEQSRNMVQNLLEFSRIGQTTLCRSSVSMNLLVHQVREYLAPQLDGRTIHWQVESLPEVQGDPAMLRLVLQNLLSNAVKYTGDRHEATITIGSRDSDQETIFWVRDNGIGFDMKYYDRLFGLFQRLHTQNQFEGTGIGLAQVRRILHRHGGRIWAEGQVDSGAIFYFSLPKQEELS